MRVAFQARLMFSKHLNLLFNRPLSSEVLILIKQRINCPRNINLSGSMNKEWQMSAYAETVWAKLIKVLRDILLSEWERFVDEMISWWTNTLKG